MAEPKAQPPPNPDVVDVKGTKYPRDLYEQLKAALGGGPVTDGPTANGPAPAGGTPSPDEPGPDLADLAGLAAMAVPDTSYVPATQYRAADPFELPSVHATLHAPQFTRQERAIQRLLGKADRAVQEHHIQQYVEAKKQTDAARFRQQAKLAEADYAIAYQVALLQRLLQAVLAMDTMVSRDIPQVLNTKLRQMAMQMVLDRASRLNQQ